MKVRVIELFGPRKEAKDNVLGMAMIEVDPEGSAQSVEVQRSWKKKDSDKWDHETVFKGTTASPFSFPCRLMTGAKGPFCMADVVLDLDTRELILSTCLPRLDAMKAKPGAKK